MFVCVPLRRRRWRGGGLDGIAQQQQHNGGAAACVATAGALLCRYVINDTLSCISGDFRRIAALSANCFAWPSCRRPLGTPPSLIRGFQVLAKPDQAAQQGCERSAAQRITATRAAASSPLPPPCRCPPCLSLLPTVLLSGQRLPSRSASLFQPCCHASPVLSQPSTRLCARQPSGG